MYLVRESLPLGQLLRRVNERVRIVNADDRIKGLGQLERRAADRAANVERTLRRHTARLAELGRGNGGPRCRSEQNQTIGKRMRNDESRNEQRTNR